MTSLAHLVSVSERVAARRGRLEKVRELSEFLRALPREDVGIAVLYLAGRIAQDRLGVGFAALRAADGQPPADTESLSLAEVDQALAALAAVHGPSSATVRRQALAALLSRASRRERSFLISLLAGELRQGALAGVMLDAVAAAAHRPAAEIRRAFMYAGLAAAAVAALGGEPTELGKFQLVTFSPVAPMLAQTAADVGAALRQLGGPAAFEWKMDGARIQVHKRAAEVRVYTRGLNELGAAVPEIVDTVRGLPAEHLILDGEAITHDAAGHPRPFQVTMRRFGRRIDVEKLRTQLPLRAFFFDCLRIDASSLIDRTTHERHRALEQALPEKLRMPRLVTAVEAEARAFYEAALAAGHEGLMAKALDAPYEAGDRGASWLKIKRVHTLDLLVLAAEWGGGRRTGKLSNLHLGALEPSSGRHVMLGKTFKGLTDVLLDWQTRELLARETHRDRGAVYVRPELVVEIAFSDLQASVRYPAGLALRLARVKRYRTDKRPVEADTMDSVRRIYAAQRA